MFSVYMFSVIVFSLVPVSMPFCATCMIEFLRIDPESVCLALRDPILLYPFIESMDVCDLAGEFVLKLGQASRVSFGSETLRILRYLQNSESCSMSSIPNSKGRVALTRIWSVLFDSSIPPHLLENQFDGLLRLLFRWMLDCTVIEDQGCILRIMKSVKKQLSGLDFNVKAIGYFLSAHLGKTVDTSTLSLFVPLFDYKTLPAVLYSYMEHMDQSTLFHVWSRLISVPLISPCQFSKMFFCGTRYPLLMLEAIVFRIIVKVGSVGGVRWQLVAETLIRMIMSKLSAKHVAVRNDTCEQLIYLMKLDVPGRELDSLLVVSDLVPVVQAVVVYAETVFNKLVVSQTENLDMLNLLIRILQDDLCVVDGGRFSANSHTAEAGRLSAIPPSAVAFNRIQSIMSSAIGSVMPADSQFLLQPPVVVNTNYLDKVYVSPAAPIVRGYTTLSSGVEVEFKGANFCGIQNFNNTCYLSSFLQALFFTDGFTCSIFGFVLQQMDKMEEKDFSLGTSIVSGLQMLFTRMLKTHHPYIEISEFIRSLPPSYRSGEQQDVTESGRWIFDKLGGTDQSLVQSVFGGELVHKTKCLNCNTVTERKEVFTDLCVSVPKESEVLGKKRVTVQGLIKQMLKPEELVGDNKYCCDQCGGTKQNATRWIEILQFPAHLMLVMHKFSFDIATCDFKKEKTVVYPENVDLVGNSYELYGSVLHYGETATKGHYVALCRRSGGNQWALLDDTNVQELSQDEANERMSGLRKSTEAAYVLFFKASNAPTAVNPKISQKMINDALAVEAAAVHL